MSLPVRTRYIEEEVSLHPTPVGIPLGITASAILYPTPVSIPLGSRLRRYSPLETIVIDTFHCYTLVAKAKTQNLWAFCM